MCNENLCPSVVPGEEMMVTSTAGDDGDVWINITAEEIMMRSIANEARLERVRSIAIVRQCDEAQADLESGLEEMFVALGKVVVIDDKKTLEMMEKKAQREADQLAEKLSEQLREIVRAKVMADEELTDIEIEAIQAIAEEERRKQDIALFKLGGTGYNYRPRWLPGAHLRLIIQLLTDKHEKSAEALGAPPPEKRHTKAEDNDRLSH